jgi:hypothetical protein
MAGATLADSGWAAIANSPSREEADYSWSPNATQAAAEAQVLQKCLVQEHATDCRVVASGPSCAAIAWDGDVPLNHLTGVWAPHPRRRSQPRWRQVPTP